MSKKIFKLVVAFFTFAATLSFGAGLIGAVRGHMPSRFDICAAFAIATIVALVAALDYLRKALGVDEP